MLALAGLGTVLGIALVMLLLGGPAQADDPVYNLPTPTPTPTPAGTPFHDPPQQPPAQPPPGGPRLMSPFPVVRTSGRFTRTRTTFTKITVMAPAGARVNGGCKPSRRCRRTTRTLQSLHVVRLKRLQRTYPPRTRITIRVGGTDVIGKYVSILTRRGKRPKRQDSCLLPGRRTAKACP